MKTILLKTREEWLMERRRGIGASEAPAILGVSPWSTPLQVYYDKLGLVDPQPDTQQMAWGRRLEPIVASAYAEETGRGLSPIQDGYELLQNAEYPFLLATLDRLIIHAEGKVTPAPLEIKTVGFPSRDAWFHEPPIHVQVQVQAQLAVTGYPWASVVVLIGGQQLLWLDIERNEPFIKAMVDKLSEFWARVITKSEPIAQGPDTDLLKILHPKESGVTIGLPADAISWDEQYQESLKQIAHWTNIKKTSMARLEQALGDASYGYLPNGLIGYSWLTVENKGYVVDPYSYRSLRRIKKGNG